MEWVVGICNGVGCGGFVLEWVVGICYGVGCGDL